MNTEHQSQRRRSVTVLACTASLAGAALGLTASEASASSPLACNSKSVAITSSPGHTGRVPVAAISVQGIGCAQAYTVIGKTLVGKPPAGWKSLTAHFKVPEGLYPQELRSGNRIIRYAIHPG